MVYNGHMLIKKNLIEEFDLVYKEEIKFVRSNVKAVIKSILSKKNKRLSKS